MDGPSGTAGGKEPAIDAADSENQQDVAAGVEEQELESALERLPLRNPISIAYLRYLAEDGESAHAELTDAEIIKLVQEPVEDEEGIAEEVLVTHSKAEKLTGLSVTISFLDLSEESHRIAHRILRRIQSDLPCKDSSTQTTLKTWLK